jgi:hypothetical protein
MSIKLLARNDDFGSTRAANRAMLEAAECGFITRNISCMAPAPYIAEGAEQLKKYEHIDIGMHATITSEWDGIRWGAMTEAMRKCAFTYEDGTFFHSQQELVDSGIDVEIILKEYDAQLDYLTRLGLPIRYVDSHMFPEYYFDDLYEALTDWICKKGLLCAEDYYAPADPLCPPTNEDETSYMKGVENWLSRLSGNKQYFYLAHPAYPSEESLLMYAADTPKGKIRQERGMEYKAVTSPRWERWLAQFDLQPVRYSEADKQGPQNLKKILVG